MDSPRIGIVRPFAISCLIPFCIYHQILKDRLWVDFSLTAKFHMGLMRTVNGRTRFIDELASTAHNGRTGYIKEIQLRRIHQCYLNSKTAPAPLTGLY